jgi:hypothetical protein
MLWMMLWMRGSFLHSSVPRPLCDCPQDRTYRTWDRTSSFVTYRCILEPMSEKMFVRVPSSWLWLLKTGDFCSPFWRSRLVLSKTTPLGEGPWDGGASCGHFFPVLTVIAVWRFTRFNLFPLFGTRVLWPYYHAYLRSHVLYFYSMATWGVGSSALLVEGETRVW